MRLFAWVGEDEFGSGEVGLKQALTHLGLIPLVATSEDAMNQPFIVDQLQVQARFYKKTIRLVEFEDVSVKRELSST
jgi:hypothetical protein